MKNKKNKSVYLLLEWINPHFNYSIASFTFIPVIILQIVVLLLNINAVLWIHKLEKLEKTKCTCSENYVRNYIKFFLYILVPMSFINICTTIYIYTYNINISITKMMKNNPKLLLVFSIINVIYTIFSLGNIILSTIFFYKLKELNCECSGYVSKDVYWIYNILITYMQGIGILILILILIIAWIFWKIHISNPIDP